MPRCEERICVEGKGQTATCKRDGAEAKDCWLRHVSASMGLTRASRLVTSSD